MFTTRAFGVPREPRICRCRRWRIGSARRLSKGPRCPASAVARPPGAPWLGGAWPSPRNSPETSLGTCAGASALCWHRLRGVCSPHVTWPRPAGCAHLDRALLCPPPGPCCPPAAAGAGRSCRGSGASPEGVGPSSCSPQQRPGPGRSQWWPELAGGAFKHTCVHTHTHTQAAFTSQLCRHRGRPCLSDLFSPSRSRRVVLRASRPQVCRAESETGLVGLAAPGQRPGRCALVLSCLGLGPSASSQPPGGARVCAGRLAGDWAACDCGLGAGAHGGGGRAVAPARDRPAPPACPPCPWLRVRVTGPRPRTLSFPRLPVLTWGRYMDVLSPQGATVLPPSCSPGMGMGFPGETEHRRSPGPVRCCGRLCSGGRGVGPARPGVGRGAGRGAGRCSGQAGAVCWLLSGLGSGPLVLAAVRPRCGGRSRSPWAEVEPRPHPPPWGPLPRRLPGPDPFFADQEPGPGHHAPDDGTTCPPPLVPLPALGTE